MALNIAEILLTKCESFTIFAEEKVDYKVLQNNKKVHIFVVLNIPNYSLVAM